MKEMMKKVSAAMMMFLKTTLTTTMINLMKSLNSILED